MEAHRLENGDVVDFFHDDGGNGVVDTERGHHQNRRDHAVHDQVAHQQHAHQIFGRFLPGHRLVADLPFDDGGDIAGGVGIVELDDETVDPVGPVQQALHPLEQGKSLVLVVAGIAGAEDADHLQGTYLPTRRGGVHHAAHAQAKLLGQPFADDDTVRIGGQRLQRALSQFFLDGGHPLHLRWDDAVEGDAFVAPGKGQHHRPHQHRRGAQAGQRFDEDQLLRVAANAAHLGQRLDPPHFDRAVRPLLGGRLPLGLAVFVGDGDVRAIVDQPLDEIPFGTAHQRGHR